MRLRPPLLAAAAASTSLLLSPVVAAWQLGRQDRFQGQEHLIDMGSLGLPETGLVAAFGDFNADQLLDLVYLSDNQRHIDVYLWDRLAYAWALRPASTITTPTSFRVVNVVPADLDYDGRLDLLLMGQANPGGGGWWGDADVELQMLAFLQQPDGSFSPPFSVPSSSLAHPMAFDATGDMRVDLLGFAPPTSKGDKATVPMLWNNNWASSNHTSLFETSSTPPLDQNSSPICSFPTPHSNAYIDLDGDCLADLFLMCAGSPPSYQIWTNDKSSGAFVLARSGQLPEGTQSVSLADMDRDGTTDLVLTVCPRGEDCTIAIAYNQQVPLCGKHTALGERCRDPEELCVADEEFSFDFTWSADNSALTTIPISALLPGQSLVTSSASFSGYLPTPPAIGDYNVDGYPDLLLLTSSGSKRHVNLLESRPCDKSSCTKGEIQQGRRAFRARTDGAEALTRIVDAESAHWIDIDDDGSLDIMVQRTAGGAARKVTFIKNNYFHDAFFLKALVLNGACQNWCEPSEDGGEKYRPYGVSYSGASYKFTVLDPTGVRKATQVGQLPQSSYLALGTPYAYFGLGRTNNYVENLFIGATRRQPSHFINIEGLIPNSQIVIDPYQPEGRSDPDSWSRELYLHPGEWIPVVTIVLGAAIILLGVVVLVLHINERREDEIERKARLLSLNFQAL